MKCKKTQKIEYEVLG